jgi:hypothetical protein
MGQTEKKAVFLTFEGWQSLINPWKDSKTFPYILNSNNSIALKLWLALAGWGFFLLDIACGMFMIYFIQFSVSSFSYHINCSILMELLYCALFRAQYISVMGRHAGKFRHVCFYYENPRNQVRRTQIDWMFSFKGVVRNAVSHVV